MVNTNTDTRSKINGSSIEKTKKQEWLAFLFITVILFPLLSVMFVGGYGFIIWGLQIVFGPPGHGV